MSASPFADSALFLQLVWGFAATFFSTAVLLCVLILLRRVWRNREARMRADRRSAFQAHVGRCLSADPHSGVDFQHPPSCETRDKSRVLLHYFRTLRGRQLERLRSLVSESSVERELMAGTFRGIRGVRTQALRTLAFLDSRRSLDVMVSHLASRDKYIALTAAQCIVQRGATEHFDTIVAALVRSFPNDVRIIGGVLAGFGPDAVPSLERMVANAINDTEIAGALTALRSIKPERLDVDIGSLLGSDVESIRSAAVALSTSTGGTDSLDIVRAGMRHPSVGVRIQSAKSACALRRTELTPDLYGLTGDPNMWVRYWSLRALWMMGGAGRKFVVSLRPRVPMARHVERECLSGYVASHV